MPATTTHIVINPATEEVVTTVELLDVEATDEAVARATAAFASWRLVAPGDRARLLRRFADAVDGDLEHLAQLEVAGFKTSGLGRELGPDAPLAFTETKNVFISTKGWPGVSWW